MSLKKISKVRFIFNFIRKKIFIIIQNVISTSNSVKSYISYLLYLKRLYISNDIALTDKRFDYNEDVYYPFDSAYSIKFYKQDYPDFEKKLIIVNDALFDNVKNIGILTNKCKTKYITLSRIIKFTNIDISTIEITCDFFPWINSEPLCIKNSQPLFLKNENKNGKKVI